MRCFQIPNVKQSEDVQVSLPVKLKVSCLVFYCLVINFSPSLIWSKHKFLLALRKFCGFWVLIFICLSGKFCTSAKRSLCSLYARVITSKCGPQLFMVTTLLVFLYFLVLSWACLFYCFLKWNIAFYFFIDLYMGKQKPILVVFSSTFSGWGSRGLPTKKCTTW